MGLFEQFPYTNFHDLNLDWILRLMKQFEGVIEGLDEAIAKEIEKQLNDKDLEEMILDALTRYGLVINVKAPPAKLEPASGDGSKDDTITIQGCIDYANANGGLAVFFPSGKYLTQSLNMKSNVTLCGFDRNTTHLVLKGGAINPLISGSVNNIELTGLTFDGNADIQVNNVDLIVLTGGNYYFNNLKLTDGFNLLTLNTNSDVDISNIVFGSAIISALVTNGNGSISADNIRFNSLSLLAGLYAIDNKVNSAVFKGIYSTVNSQYAIRNMSNNSVFIGQIIDAVNTHIDSGTGNYYEFYNRGGTVSELINTERIDRENVDNELREGIETEATARAEADIVLQENITAEATARAEADIVLQENITAEVTARAEADVMLEENINISNSRINNICVNVLDYGAVGDGITDDSEAFQNAINSGYDIYVPTNRGQIYLIGNTLNMSKVRQTIYGDINVRSMENSAAVGYIKCEASPAFNVTQMNVHFQSLSFKSSLGDYAAPIGTCLNIDSTAIADNADCIINNCYFFAFEKTVIHKGRGLSFINNIVVESTRTLELSYTFNGSGGAWSQQPDTGFRAVRVVNNRYHGVNTIIYVAKGILVGALITQNVSDTGSTLIVTSIDASLRYCIINNNSVMFSGVIPVTFNGPVEDCVISGNVFISLPDRRPVYFIHAVFQDSSPAFSRNVISNNVFNWCSGDGLLLNRELVNCIINGNVFRNIGNDAATNRACIRTRSLTNCSIEGNTFDPVFVPRCINVSNQSVTGTKIESNSHGNNTLIVNMINSGGGNDIQEYKTSAIPTVGTWRVGDVLFKTNPTDFIGWVCTVAGSPGTWVPFGAIIP